MGDEALSRVIQGITAGIGFLGAGSILKDVRRLHIEGLTTAASIWLTAAIGIAVGLGREGSAVLGTALALAVLAFAPHVSPQKDEGPREDGKAEDGRPEDPGEQAES